MKESDSNIIKKIKNFLNTNIIPLKEVSENSLKGYFVSFEKEENDEDILLIIGIISKDYNNYFHYENIKRISEYIQNVFNKKCSGDKYNGFGKLIFDNGYYYIGQFKDNIPNGKGNAYDQNGNLMYEGDFINGVREGNGKLIVDNGYYYIGQFKDNIINGKGNVYDKNGNVMYEGDFINGVREGNRKLIVDNGYYYIGQFKDNIIN